MTARPILGIRQSVPPGTVLARLKGTGPLEPVSLAELTTALVRTGKVAGAGGGSGGGEWAAGTVTAIDPRMIITGGTLDLVSSATQLRTVAFPIVGMPPATQEYNVVVTQAGTLLADGGSPAAYIPTLPAAATDLALNTIHSGVTTTHGTIGITTGGVVTFPTFPAVSLVDGDVIQLVNAAVQDALFTDASFSLQYAVSEAVAVPTTEEWLAGTVTAVGAGLAVAAGTISATGGVQEWSAGTVTTVGTGLSITSGTIAASGGGGSASVVLINGGTVATVVGSNTRDAIVPGLSATITATATAALAWVEWGAVTQSGSPPHNMRWRIYNGATIAFPLGFTAGGVNLEEAINSDGAGWCGGKGLITIPGDGAAHVISVQWQASGSTATFDIYDRSMKITL